MPGLLDFTSDPQGMQGLALLAAAAPSMAPQNFAGRLAQAGSNYQGLLNDQLKQKVTQAQLSEFNTKNQLQQFQLQRLKDWQSLLTGGGASPAAPTFGPDDIKSPGAFMPAADGMGPVAPLDQAPAALTASAPQGFQFGLRGMPDANSRAVAASMTPDEYMKLYATQAAPQTDIEKLMAAQGIDRSSPLGQQLLSQQIKKLNNIPLQPGRAGAPMYDGSGNIVAFSPKIPDNAIPQIVGGRVVGVSPLPGAASVAQINSYAGAAGKNQAEPMPAFRGNQPVFTNKLAAATGADAFGSPPAAGMTGNFKGNPADVINSIAQMTDPKEQANALAALEQQMRASGGKLPPASSEITPAPQLGAEKGATLSQAELSDKGKTLMADNAQTNTVISRLQNIKMLTPGAITGAEAGRRDFMNGLLSLAGIQGAKDAKTASDLVDKNQAQIVTALRMGQGGAGTDALQTLLGAANPNRHMTKEAMNEAVDQLIASQKMIQSKAQLLQPHYLGRDPVAYGSKELAFDQNADPRVWQMQAMPPQQQAAYIKSLPANVAADMLKKYQALKQVGVFQ